jgi:hypothetical protein
MACNSCKVGPCTCNPEGYAKLSAQEGADTLIGSLTCVVDSIRNLYTTFGARTYQVQLVWTRWSGGERGSGCESVVLAEPILPTPLVSNLKALRVELESIGSMEEGGVIVSQISPRYTEAELQGFSRFVVPGNPLPDDMSFYWEIFYPGTDGDGVRRRFVPKSAPNSDPTAFEWSISLTRQSEDRTTLGEIR